MVYVLIPLCIYLFIRVKYAEWELKQFKDRYIKSGEDDD